MGDDGAVREEVAGGDEGDRLGKEDHQRFLDPQAAADEGEVRAAHFGIRSIIKWGY